jgi:hypothetical protein
MVGPQGAIGCSRRIGSVREGYADLRGCRRLHGITLRFKPRNRRRDLVEPHQKNTGGNARGDIMQYASKKGSSS